MADLKLTNIGKTYKGGVDVLKGINLDIKRGELIVLLALLDAENQLERRRSTSEVT